MTCLIICLTIIICVLLVCGTVVYLTQFIRWMSQHQLPMYTHAELQWVPSTSSAEEPKAAVGFQTPVEEKTEEQMSDVEKLDKLLADTASTVSALLRGEVDFDDIKQ